jgi:haloacetate dehalogenase
VFEEFTRTDVDLGEVRVHVRHGGSGPPLLLLHGNPLTHVSWHAVASPLAERFTVVAADLRGYGDSSAPVPSPDASNYSFRSTARDQVALMRELGHRRFSVAGHDRGGRVVHRLCLDSPEAVVRAAVLDIVPTQHMFANTSREWALAYWHWSFLAHEPDLPERMLGAVPARWFLEQKLGLRSGSPTFFDERALAEYVRCFTPETVRAVCADYRSAATVDLDLDTADLPRRVQAPLLVLWGSRSNVSRLFRDPLSVWRQRGDDVTGHAVDAGHYVNEEAPAEVLAAFLDFFGPQGATAGSCSPS